MRVQAARHARKECGYGECQQLVVCCVYARGLGGDFILADGDYRAALTAAQQRVKHDHRDYDDNVYIGEVGYTRYAAQTLGSAGELDVGDKYADYFAKAQGDYRKVVALEPERRYAYGNAEQRRDYAAA